MSGFQIIILISPISLRDFADFDNQMATLRAKYVDQFAAMDAAVASLNKTKDSLNMMMDGWRASMK